MSHYTPPAPSQEGKGEAVDAAESGVRYTYIYCNPESRLPSLVERGWGRGKMPLQPRRINTAETQNFTSLQSQIVPIETTVGIRLSKVSPGGDLGGNKKKNAEKYRQRQKNTDAF
jgi:hypothetical protein